MRVSIANGECQVSIEYAFIRRTCCRGPSSLASADNLLSAD
ncbi:hypothetical protein LTSEUGA_0544 [Salmonella enterica subsp. enterica serovar Uganda str. R8-3404]|uniref:Uncharacterized protein n=1 Tax=Salmonella enterica subsp. enterica serovar Uganda str. R8-3404 TaxID=913083 RepID=A0A6C8H7M4_SALET|nr:hypothetical protein LTSEUGA_0544 [Salmonella enterica subsp. enterica serovar Uganda str. R8-3404]